MWLLLQTVSSFPVCKTVYGDNGNIDYGDCLYKNATDNCTVTCRGKGMKPTKPVLRLECGKDGIFHVNQSEVYCSPNFTVWKNASSNKDYMFSFPQSGCPSHGHTDSAGITIQSENDVPMNFYISHLRYRVYLSRDCPVVGSVTPRQLIIRCDDRQMDDFNEISDVWNGDLDRYHTGNESGWTCRNIKIYFVNELHTCKYVLRNIKIDYRYIAHHEPRVTYYTNSKCSGQFFDNWDFPSGVDLPFPMVRSESMPDKSMGLFDFLAIVTTLEVKLFLWYIFYIVIIIIIFVILGLFIVYIYGIVVSARINTDTTKGYNTI